ncbi:MAG: FkbM family methyltransferase [Mucilaginibacter sp.]
MLRNLSQQGLNYGNGGNIDISGEITLMKFLADKYKDARTYIIFDAGANQGDYCTALLNNITVKDLQVWCFEPSADTFKKLQANHATNTNVILNNIGLGHKKSNVPLYTDQPGSVIASIYALERAFGTEEKLSDFEMVNIETIDGFMEDHNIPYIDLLKLDIEGNELNALFGAKNMIKAGKIKAIQFEFGICNIDSRTFFRDFWNLLSPQYNIYRLLKDDLYPVTYYSEYDEVFATINYYAELK